MQNFSIDLTSVKDIAVKLLFNRFNGIFCAFVVGGVTGSLIWDSDYPVVARLILTTVVCYCIGWTMPSIFTVPKGLSPKPKKT